jgi:GT2 family glycosyltransferase
MSADRGHQTHSPTPGVSVVVPVKGRVEEMSRLLASLATGAARCPEPVEILVVDDSSPAEARAHREHCEIHGARYVAGPRHVGAKRNLGVALAGHDLILFTDSDCRVSRDLLRRYVLAMRGAPADVAGVAGPTIVEDSRTTTFRIMRRSHLLHADLEMPLAGRDLLWATTCNLMVRRDAILAAGGFVRESLTIVGGEDIDLGIKLAAHGYRIRSDPEAVVTHDRMSSDSLRSVSRRLFHYGRSEQWLTTVYPRYRAARFNPITMTGIAAILALAARHRSRGRSLVLVPVVAGAAIGLRARRRVRPGDSMLGVTDSVLCAALECIFDVGAAVAAFQLRRPGLLFTGLKVTNHNPTT